MKSKQWITGRGGPVVLFLLALILAGGLLVGGCESDSVAPHDELPALTEAEAVQQAALVASGIARVGSTLLDFQGSKSSDKELGVYIYTFPAGGDVSGSVILEYFAGGAGGSHVPKEDADFGMFYTPEGEGVIVQLELSEVFQPVFQLTFALEGDIDQEADSATVSGTGTMTTGDMTSAFTFTDMVLTELSDYPDGGTFGFVAGAVELVVEYDGDHLANVLIDGVIVYEIDLDTGLVTLADS